MVLPSLAREEGLIDGHWVTSENSDMFAVTNPTNEEIVANVEDFGASEAEKAIDSAHKVCHNCMCWIAR